MNPVVVRVITWLPVGGIERRLVSVLPRLRDLGWGMKVVCLREEGPLARQVRDQGIDVTVIPFGSRLSPRGIWRLKNHLRRANASIVHSHMYRSNVPATIAARFARTPVVLAQVHNVDSWDTPRQVATDRALAPHRNATLCVSRAVQRDVIEKLGISEQRAPILYNGIDTQVFQPDMALREEFRRGIGAAHDQVVIVIPARLHMQKNPVGMLQAFRVIHAESGFPKPILLFVGEGKAESQLRSMASDLGESVRFLGRRDDMPSVYNGADVMLLSSLKEGFSNAIVEALACGKPVVASDVGGNAEAVNSHAVGWIHPPMNGSDIEPLCVQLREAVSKGVDGLGAMQAACAERASHFSLDALVEATDQLYRKYLGFGPS
ncbi:glycosyltransferase [Candidatus Sumerlaeota bacterium]|nr:glycosyltransferase [Candidatus Sumerlaeota bacterium]